MSTGLLETCRGFW